MQIGFQLKDISCRPQQAVGHALSKGNKALTNELSIEIKEMIIKLIKEGNSL